MSRRTIQKWLYRNLPKMVEAGILSDFQQEAVWVFYEQEYRLAKRRMKRIVWIMVGVSMLLVLGGLSIR